MRNSKSLELLFKGAVVLLIVSLISMISIVWYTILFSEEWNFYEVQNDCISEKISLGIERRDIARTNTYPGCEVINRD